MKKYESRCKQSAAAQQLVVSNFINIRVHSTRKLYIHDEGAPSGLQTEDHSEP